MLPPPSIALDEAPSELNDNGKEQNAEAQNIAARLRKRGKAYFQFITPPPA